MTKLKYGMVGGGPGAFIGAVHRAAIRLNDEAQLVAGCFSNIEAEIVQAGEELGIDTQRNYRTFEEKWPKGKAAREDKIDWVDIVTPNRFHYPAAKLFLQQGISVVCEKPLCFTVKQGEELKRLAQEKGCLILRACIRIRAMIMTREARQLFRNGVIGKVRMVIAEYPQDWLIDSLENVTEENKPWRTDPALSGRGACVADLGTHIENWVSYVSRA